MMSRCQKVVEITVRVIVIVFQLIAIVGGGLLLGLYPADDNNNRNYSGTISIGSVVIGVGTVVLIYEIIMIILVFVEKVNHPARLLVDVILSTVMSALSILATIGSIVLAVFLILSVKDSSLGIVLGLLIAAVFVLPVGFGVIYTILFIVCALSSGLIRSQVISQARQAPSPSSVEGGVPKSLNMITQEPLCFESLSGNPPNYNSFVTKNIDQGDANIARHIPQNDNSKR